MSVSMSNKGIFALRKVNDVCHGFMQMPGCGRPNKVSANKQNSYYEKTVFCMHLRTRSDKLWFFYHHPHGCHFKSRR